MSPTCSNRRSARGSALVEFALAFSLLWPCFYGMFEYGHALYLYNALSIAVANAGFYASRVDFDQTAQTFVAKIQNVAVYGGDTGGTSPLAPGLTTGQVFVTWTVDSSGVPQTITVSIQGYSPNILFGRMTWNGKPRTTVRFMGVLKS